MNMENLVVYENESGVFTCDAEGRLLKYESSPENRLEPDDCRGKCSVFGEDWWKYEFGKERKAIRKLVIPAGVKQIGSCSSDSIKAESAALFKGYVVRDEIVFPESLKRIGGHVFWNAVLPEVRFSSALDVIGMCSFFHASICKLILSSDIKPVYEYGCYYSDKKKEFYFKDVPGQGAVEITESEVLEQFLCYGGRQFKYARIDTLVVPDGYRGVLSLLTESNVRKVVKYREYDVSGPENSYHDDAFAYLNWIWKDLE